MCADLFPHIVLLGRPNVGKSTLFNRLIRSNRAITHDRPGITRDRMEGIVLKNSQPLFTLVDTGGLNLAQDGSPDTGPAGIRGFEEAIFFQVQEALKKAAVLALVVDAKSGLLPLDFSLAAIARRTGLPVLCVVNKVDGREHEGLLSDFHALGLPLIALSAAHGYHIPELLDALVAMLPKTCASLNKESSEKSLRIALLGRPNAGKSSLVNALVGEERMIISDVPGTTRDSVDVRATLSGISCVFVDTAGVRRKTRIEDPVERFSVNASLKSTTKADITLVVLDMQEGLGSQDKRLIDLLDRRKTPFFILANKCDLLSGSHRKKAEKALCEDLSFLPHIPILFISAKEKTGLGKILPLAQRIVEECQMRVPTGQLNRAMQSVLSRHEPPIVNRARPRFFYLTQAESSPPTFVFFVSDATRVPDSYLRYLERGLRSLFGIRHAPLRMHLRSSHKS